jgi:hypothetical protein
MTKASAATPWLVLAGLVVILILVPHVARAQAGPALAPWPADDKEQAEIPDSRPGEVTFFCNVSGAEVHVDGMFIGTLPNPAPLELSAGKHRIEVRAKGYKTVAKELVLPAGKGKYVHVDLVEDPEAVVEEDTSVCKSVDTECLPDEDKIPVWESGHSECRPDEVHWEGNCFHKRAKKGWKVLVRGGYVHLGFFIFNIGMFIPAAYGWWGPADAVVVYPEIYLSFALANGLVSGLLLGYGYRYKKQWKVLTSMKLELPEKWPPTQYPEKYLQRYRKQWLGLVIAGYTSIAASVGFWAYWIWYCSIDDTKVDVNYDLATASLVLAPVLTASGLILITIGHIYQSRWKRFGKKPTAASITPLLAPVQGGGMVGIGGTF